jgi:hypothetical protein
MNQPGKETDSSEFKTAYMKSDRKQSRDNCPVRDESVSAFHVSHTGMNLFGESDVVIAGHIEPELMGRHAEAGLEDFVKIAPFSEACFQGDRINGLIRIL